MIKYFQAALEKGLREEVAGGKESDKPLQPNSPANVTQQNMQTGIHSHSLIISYKSFIHCEQPYLHIHTYTHTLALTHPLSSTHHTISFWSKQYYEKGRKSARNGVHTNLKAGNTEERLCSLI